MSGVVAQKGACKSISEVRLTGFWEKARSLLMIMILITTAIFYSSGHYFPSARLSLFWVLDFQVPTLLKVSY